MQLPTRVLCAVWLAQSRYCAFPNVPENAVC